jgi:hypothetical protein
LSAATAALLSVLATANRPLPTLLCLVSLICNLGSAIAGTTLLCRFESVRSLRLAWFQGGVWAVLALSAPHGWLRWGITAFLAALFTFIWTTQPLATKVVGAMLISSLFLLFFILPLIGETFRVWGPTQLFTSSFSVVPDISTE